ncbi:probable protein phosphatase 2C 37 [Triticum aestivum]|uniref:probable protein phosphatase 2C 37 n=1 Tax=Triticum aestivum TaxID=4565 RepID=UPI001D007844|nr:probable protein phosphatase 2C 37 [Triticum aestivum]
MEDKVSLRPSFFTRVNGSRMHFFAVFDGHGGPEVSALCRDHMHAIREDELARASAAYRKETQQHVEAEDRAWKATLTRSFAQADELRASAVPQGTIGGSTAMVALLVRGRIIVAKCGDSRAVLCHAGRAIPLSQDHSVDELKKSEEKLTQENTQILLHMGDLKKGHEKLTSRRDELKIQIAELLKSEEKNKQKLKGILDILSE